LYLLTNYFFINFIFSRITYPPKEGGVGLRWEDGGDGDSDLEGERLRRPRLGVGGGLLFLLTIRRVGLRGGFGLRLRLKLYLNTIY